MIETPKSRWIVEAVELHQSALIRYARWILSDLESAREVVQETFLRLCKEDPARIEQPLDIAAHRLAQSRQVTRCALGLQKSIED